MSTPTEQTSEMSVTVLIVEDDEGLNHLIKKNLEHAGFRTVQAFNGAEALAAIAANRNIILILDYSLPDLTGKQIIETLSAQQCEVPFIIMTGYGDEQIAVDMMKLGARDYLIKQGNILELLPQMVLNVCQTLAQEQRLQTAEATQRETERRFREILENVHLVAVMLDTDGKITFCNDYLLTLTGWTREEALGQDWVRNFLPPEIQPAIRSGFLETIATGSFPMHFENEIITKRGERRLIAWTNTVLRDARGNVSGTNSLGEDITQRKRQEGELLRLRKAVETMPLGVTVTDLDGAILYINPADASMHGYAPEELISQDVRLFAPPALRKPVALEEIKQWKKLTRESTNIRKDGRTFPVWLISEIIRDANGEPTAIVTSCEDITARKQAEEELHSHQIELEMQYQELHAAQIKLQESQRKYADLYDFAPVGYCIIDQNGRVAEANLTAATLLGVNREQLLNIRFYQFVPKEERDGLFLYLRQFSLTNRQQTCELRLIKPDGTEFFAQLDTVFIPESDDHSRCYRTVISDITVRKQAEEALKTRTRQQAAVVMLGRLALAETTIADLLDEAVHLVVHTLDVPLCKVLELLPDGQNFLLQAGVGWSDGLVGQATVPTHRASQAGYTLSSGSPVVVTDFAHETRFHTPQLLRDHQAASGISVVIDGAQRPFGVLGAHDIRPRGFAKDDINFLTAIANVLSAAIARKQSEQALQNLTRTLEQRVRERTAELEALNQTLRQEISERQQAEARLLLLHNAVETTTVGVTITDIAGNIVYVNPAEAQMHGYAITALIGQPARLFAPPEFAQPITFEQHQPHWERESLNRRQDGSMFPVHLVSTPVHNAAGEPVGIITVSEDITEWKQFELELQQAKEAADAANRAKSDFLANMSHELRTPLNAILGYAQILHDAGDLPEHSRKGLATIQRSGEYLLTLIKDILDLAKIEAGRLELQSDEVAFPEFLSTIVEMIRVKADQKDLALVYEPDPTLPQGIYTDEKRLREILLNLLGNAVKFTDQGTVTFRILDLGCEISDSKETPQSHDAHSSHQNSRIFQPVSGQAKILKFEISDTGTGIRGDKLGDIFAPFQQTGDQRYQIEGTGLGLAISRRLVELMGGELQVESRLGEGSLFWFEVSLPIIPNFIPPSASRNKPRVTGYLGRRRRVLVIDDQQTNREMLLAMLEPLGFETCVAENGQQGIAQYLQCAPDVILLDLLMPEMDGFELAERLRALEQRKPEAPEQQAANPRPAALIAISANVSEEIRARSLRAGCDDFLPKPFRTSELLECLARHSNVEWVSEKIEKPDMPTPSAAAHDAAALLEIPPDERRQLLQHAKRGDAKMLLAQLTRIEQEHPRCLPTVLALRDLARGFQVDRIVDMLEEAEKRATR